MIFQGKRAPIQLKIKWNKKYSANKRNPGPTFFSNSSFNYMSNKFKNIVEEILNSLSY